MSPEKDFVFKLVEYRDVLKGQSGSECSISSLRHRAVRYRNY